MPPYSDIHSHSCNNGPSSSSSQPLHARLTKSTSSVETHHELLQLAALELDAMRSPSSRKNKRGSNGSLSSTGSSGSNRSINSASSSSSSPSLEDEEVERSFPPACLHLLHSLPGNSRCHDCNNSRSSMGSSSYAAAEWASVSYGITLCLQCSGKHRGLGVRSSFIKSLTLDSWKRREILAMLEGGNVQLSSFFDRHGMGGADYNDDSNGTKVEGLDRYNTKAASFYRQHLMSHARELAEKDGLYQGREASRNKKNCRSSKSAGKNKAKSGGCRKKPREAAIKKMVLPTVAERESVVEQACGTVGA